MLGLRDKVKEQTGRMLVTRPIETHLTNWLNMLGLRDKVKWSKHFYICYYVGMHGY